MLRKLTQNLKLDSLRFLTLFTKLESHSVFCIRGSAFCKILVLAYNITPNYSSWNLNLQGVFLCACRLSVATCSKFSPGRSKEMHRGYYPVYSWYFKLKHILFPFCCNLLAINPVQTGLFLVFCDQERPLSPSPFPTPLYDFKTVWLTLIIVSLVCNVCYDFKLFG